jgi:hypothetical protein
MDKSFYFQAQKYYILDVLRFEFDRDAFDSTDQHDECPSITLTIPYECFWGTMELYYKVYLPSDYEGDYSEFIIMQLDYTTQDGADGKFIDGFKNLAEVVKFFAALI